MANFNYHNFFDEVLDFREIYHWTFPGLSGKLSVSMKESYFIPETMAGTAGEMRRQAQNLAAHRPLAFQAQRSALLVLDMQRYFLDPASHAYVPSAAAITPGLAALTTA